MNKGSQSNTNSLEEKKTQKKYKKHRKINTQKRYKKSRLVGNKIQTYSMERNICKHFMYGYCKLKHKCPKEHIDILCQNYRECDNNGCVKRHPKTCRYFARNRRCRYERCAYSHDEDGIDFKIETAENEISALRDDIKELKKTNKEKLDDVQVEARCNSKQLATLINNVNEVVERLRIVEQDQTKPSKCIVNVEEAKAITDKECKESEAEHLKHPNGDTLECPTVKNTTTNNIKELRDCNAKKYWLKCPKCEYICEKRVNLDKHINTKHEGTHSDARLCNSKCSFCKELFEN